MLPRTPYSLFRVAAGLAAGGCRVAPQSEKCCAPPCPTSAPPWTTPWLRACIRGGGTVGFEGARYKQRGT